MQNENKALIKELYDAFKVGNGKRISELFHPEIEWKQMEGFPNGGTYVGAKEIFEKVFGQFPKDWNNWKAVPNDFIAVEDKVFVLGHYEGTGKTSGQFFKAPIVHLYTINEGVITHFQQFTDTHIINNALKGL